jgi:broad specificity phosphatase PhoE
MRLYIVRHGDPDYAVDGLTPRGHLEAQALAKRMKLLDPDHLFVSPLGRARATARYSEEALGKTATVLDWVREKSDWREEVLPWGSRMIWDIPGEILREKVPPPLYDDWGKLALIEGKGYPEKYEALRKDSDAFLASFGYQREGGRYRPLRPNQEKVVVFCHGGFGLHWFAHLLELPVALVWSGFWMAPTSVTTILMDEASKEWATPRCVGFCDVSHLYAEGLQVSTHGLKDNVV